MTDWLTPCLSDDLNVWKKLISELLRHYQTFQNIRGSEHQIISNFQTTRQPVSKKAISSDIIRNFQKLSDILRLFQTFSDYFRHSQTISDILRSLGHQMISMTEIQIVRFSVLQIIRYFQVISVYQTVGWSDLQAFSDNFRQSDCQLIRSSDILRP